MRKPIDRSPTSSSELKIDALPAWDTWKVWPDVAPQIAAAIRHGGGAGHSLEQIKECLFKGELGLWVVRDAGGEIIGSVTLWVEPYRQALEIFTLAGSRFPEWQPMMQKSLANFARAIGVTRMQAHMRRGFARKLARTGWKPVTILMELEVNGKEK